VYHVELRQFPHNFCRFNLDERELRALVEPLVRGEWVEFGERKWNAQQARITVLEGPHMPNDQLTMGRGWQNAQRKSEDVTERLLAQARTSVVAPAQPSPPTPPQAPAPPDGGPSVDSLALDLLALLGDAPAPLHQAWQLACQRFPGRSAGDCLTLAEHALRSLLRSRLLILVPAGASGSDDVLDGDDLERRLAMPDSWSGDGQKAGLVMRRS